MGLRKGAKTERISFLIWKIGKYLCLRLNEVRTWVDREEAMKLKCKADGSHIALRRVKRPTEAADEIPLAARRKLLKFSTTSCCPPKAFAQQFARPRW